MNRRNRITGKAIGERGLPMRYIRDEVRVKIEGDLEPVNIFVFQKTEDEKLLLKLLKAEAKRKALSTQ